MTIQEQIAQLTQQITDQKTLIHTLTGEERHQAICALGELILRQGELSILRSFITGLGEALSQEQQPLVMTE